jgi:effector-binding domain-containing protein
MMEPISFTLALGSIPGIFTSIVDCYQYIQFGREFENDFEISLCKLEASEMRLTRWGVAMGIDSPDTRLRAESYNEEEIKKAYHWLKEIKRSFDTAMETSVRYTTTAKPDKLQVLDTDTEINKRSISLKALHEKMRNINDERMKPRKRDRIAWALYRKGSFENLIENIAELTTNLTELFPSTIDSQKELAKSEVGIMDTSSLRLLKEAIGEEDYVLRPVLQSEIEKRPNVFSDIKIQEQFLGQFGDNVAAGEESRSGHYTHIDAGGSAVAHFGSNIGNFRGRTIFDAVRKK